MTALDLEQINVEGLNWKDVAFEIASKNGKGAVDVASTILTTKYAFKTMLDNEETWFYDNGCYHQNGDNIIKKIVQEQEPVQGLISSHFVNEVIASVKFINVDIYKDFDVTARIAKDDELDAMKKKINKLEGQNKEFGKQLNALKNMIMPGKRPAEVSECQF